MAFPQDVLPLVVELYLDGAWVDVTSHVYRRDMINIRRGRADEAGHVDASTCNLTLNNRDGRYSPRNPTGPYFGHLTRNTPIRVAVEHGHTYLDLPGGNGDEITTPDASALGITGDIDIRIEATLLDWRAVTDLAGKWLDTGDQRSWALYINESVLVLEWSPTGSSSTLAAWTTVPVPIPSSGRQALRVTLDVNNGSSGHTVTFYRADSIDGSWEQLGEPVVTAGTTSIFDSTASLEVGDIAALADGAVVGRVHAFELRNGIDGTVVANPDLSTQTPGAGSFADAAGNTWTVQGNAAISNRQYRFHGEVSSWPPRWDISGQDVWTPIEAAGVLRRLGQGGTMLGSALYRGRVLDSPGLVAYWPMEDAAGSTSLAPALDHGPLSIIGSPQLASYDGLPASAPLPVLNDAEFRGSAPAYEDTGSTQVRFIAVIPSEGAENDQALLTIYTTGTVRRWEVHYGTGGTLGLRAYDASGTTPLFDTGDVTFQLDGKAWLIGVELVQDGSDIDYNLLAVEPGAGLGSQFPGTLTSNTVGRVGSVVVNPSGGLTQVAIGHLTVQNTITSLFDQRAQLGAWQAETAGRRIERLCAEEGVTFRPIGDLDETVRMGPQRPDTLLNLIRAAATADGGMLYEPRDVLGLGYRTRESLYNQRASLALDYEQHELADAPSPVDDDQAIVNDVTVTKEGGSSARAVQETGALSVLPPPDGVGRYPSEVTVNVQYDLDLFEQAAWRLHLGTVDEARYPQLVIDLAHESFAGDGALTTAVYELEVGDRVTVNNPPSWLPPEAISQLVQGYSEELGNFEHSIVLNCSPESPYRVATYDGTARYEPYDTVLAEDLDTTETSVDITTPTGPLWSTSASGFQIVVGGEVMTVTAVGSATGTVQTLTVVRSVNGVVKSHESGAEVRMFQPAIYAL